MNQVEEGRVVISRAGRDKGRLLAVLRVDGEYAYLVDGKERTLAKPKKKKIKHVFPQKERLDILLDLKNRDSVVCDARIRELLQSIGAQGGVDACRKTM
jgi:ribosomal protein L14E/L6E/L27E